jgi:SAM-dependent methyltransferase
MTSNAERIRRHYEPRVDPQRENYEILDWGTREGQLARFRVLADALRRELAEDPVVPTLVDVGCGMTDLADYLREQELGVRYVGVDLTLAVIQEALRRYPGRRLVQGDVFTASPFQPGSIDVSYCSGVFNLQLGNNRQFVLNAVPALLAQSRRLVVVNMLHIRTRVKYPHCCYLDPDDIAPSLAPFAERIEIVDDYLENDFTLILHPLAAAR